MSTMINELSLNEIEAVVGGVDALAGARRPIPRQPGNDTTTSRQPVPGSDSGTSNIPKRPTSGTMNQPQGLL